MKSLVKKAVRFLAAEDGPTSVEYAMMMLLVFLACFSGIMLFGETLSESFQSSDNSLQEAFDLIE